jgi:mitotic spindle assembly checkpoint protein MAD2
LLSHVVCPDYAINSILYQRGIYPSEDFEQKKKYGLALMVTKDAGVRQYLNKVLSQIQSWLMSGDIQKLVVAIIDIDSNDTKERWNFDIQMDMEAAATGSEKPQQEIVNEIRTIIRQITSSVTYLPLLEGRCTFDILIYANQQAPIPTKWEESGARLIENSDQVRLYSFSTNIHKVDSLVSYQAESM